MAEERRDAPSLYSEEGKEMKCPKCGYDEVEFLKSKNSKIEKLTEWLDDDRRELDEEPNIAKVVRELLLTYTLTDGYDESMTIWAGMCVVLRRHPHTPIRRGRDG